MAPKPGRCLQGLGLALKEQDGRTGGTRSRGAEDGPQARQVSPGPRACAKGTGRENWVRRGQGSLRGEGTAGTSGAGGEV